MHTMTESLSPIFPSYRLTLQTKRPIAEVLACIEQVTDDLSLDQGRQRSGSAHDFKGQIVNRTFDLAFPNPLTAYRLQGTVKEVGFKTEVHFKMSPLAKGHMHEILRGVWSLIFLVGLFYFQAVFGRQFPWAPILVFLGGILMYVKVVRRFREQAELMRAYFLQLLDAK